MTRWSCLLNLLVVSLLNLRANLLTGMVYMPQPEPVTGISACSSPYTARRPVLLYYMGDAAPAKAGIICGFLMILQNLPSIITLQQHDRSPLQLPGLQALLGNRVIIGTMAGMAVSAMDLTSACIGKRPSWSKKYAKPRKFAIYSLYT